MTCPRPNKLCFEFSCGSNYDNMCTVGKQLETEIKGDYIMKGSEIFRNEINAIHNKELAQFVEHYMDEIVPKYFYEIPASQSGKYHPWYSLGYGGLVRHTKAAVVIAVDLLSLEQYKNLPSDEIIAALIMHDTFKCGETNSGHTQFTHPLIACDKIMESGKYSTVFDKIHNIANCVASHMGQWNNQSGGSTMLPKPLLDAEQFVHMCDYLASRNYIVVEVQ